MLQPDAATRARHAAGAGAHLRPEPPPLSAVGFMPRLVAFYQDVVDDEVAASVGWRTIAWGLVLPDGSALTVPVDGPRAVTLWHGLDDAAAALDAYVDAPDPGGRLVAGGDGTAGDGRSEGPVP